MGSYSHHEAIVQTFFGRNEPNLEDIHLSFSGSSVSCFGPSSEVNRLNIGSPTPLEFALTHGAITRSLNASSPPDGIQF
jgi:hypothetical protein